MTRRAKRITLVHYTTPSILGGVEQVMGAHASALRDAGARVTIVAGRGRATRGVRLVKIPEADSRHAVVQRDFDSLARGERGKGHDALVQRLERALRPHVADADRVVVHNVLTMHKNLALAEAIARLAAAHPGKVIAWTHDLAWCDPQYAAQRHRGDPWDLIARALPGVRYVAVSEERAKQLAQLVGLPLRKVSVVTNGVALGTVLGLSAPGAALVARLGLGDADPLLLLPARITRRKRIEAAIDAVAELRSRGRAAMLVVTGSPGPHNRANVAYLDDLVARAAKVEGAHLLFALGHRPTDRTMADLYSLADALVLPSESEGFGIPILEAGLRRLPIVCSDLATLRAVAGDGATYVPPEANGATIADAVLRALDNETARRASRAKAHAWSRVTRERVLPVILEDAQ